ncbi:MAG: GGDEF domain-containing protein [Rubrivivax sp.]|nr:GGDEF domain-containing protein [Rubrivivax sp.]
MSPEAAAPAAQLAKAALVRLAQARLEPTPENFARAYAEEAGAPPPPAAAAAAPAVPAAAVPWGGLIERVVRGLERGGKQWTAAKRKQSLQRVLEGASHDEQRLAPRLQALLQAWEADRAQAAVETLPEPAGPASGADPGAGAPGRPETADPGHRGEQPAGPLAEAVAALHAAVESGLGDADERAAALARRLRHAARTLDERCEPGAAHQVVSVAAEAQRWFDQRHEVVRQLGSLCAELAQGLTELTEDASFSRGQCEALRMQLQQPPELRGLREAGAVLADTRARQASVRREREEARAALKELLAGMVGEVGALQQQTGGFESAFERHAAAVESAESLPALATVVQAMLADSRRIRSAVSGSHHRLQQGAERAAALEARVRDLEGELRRISDQAHTDALTQVANRRGLERLFAQECERAARTGHPLALGLLDIDNFKKLNDRLGHAAGDTALKSLAGAVRQRLRPGDHVARFGGEEFVVLMSGLGLEESRQALTRLQRSLSASLFLHDGEEVFVTFSAGVTLWREGEPLEVTVERADGGLYQAKRNGKNQTCPA